MCALLDKVFVLCGNSGKKLPKIESNLYPLLAIGKKAAGYYLNSIEMIDMKKPEQGWTLIKDIPGLSGR